MTGTLNTKFVCFAYSFPFLFSSDKSETFFAFCMIVKTEPDTLGRVNEEYLTCFFSNLIL